ncbi:hypothetical protein NQ318_011474 [Aromia moschata]|uniref:Double jelly roll-like domain-containing protein n=1 Tax=Aromia moschata TaxID=1265417 RepID=A0AAV8X483_9CUCU|nr:hypothetical protein NQ318_011474 [Aromia moschata]
MKFDMKMVEVSSIVLCNPGITSIMKGYVSYAENESGKLLNAGWSPLANPIITDNKGIFKVCIPLKMLVGFARSYNKIIMNARQELILLRSNTELNSIPTNKADEKPKIVLNKILWKVPHISWKISRHCIQEVGNYKSTLYCKKQWNIHRLVKTTSQLEKTRFVIIGFKTDRKNVASRMISYFDHCNLQGIASLHLNSDVYPYDNINLSFINNQWAIL